MFRNLWGEIPKLRTHRKKYQISDHMIYIIYIYVFSTSILPIYIYIFLYVLYYIYKFYQHVPSFPVLKSPIFDLKITVSPRHSAVALPGDEPRRFPAAPDQSRPRPNCCKPVRFSHVFPLKNMKKLVDFGGFSGFKW